MAEIRRLRQRLEKIDITKDPEQILIFQNHFTQRITSLETTIEKLKTQSREKEEMWERERVETVHRLSREKTVAVEELQQSMNQLEKSLKSEQLSGEELKGKLTDLTAQLASTQVIHSKSS